MFSSKVFYFNKQFKLPKILIMKYLYIIFLRFRRWCQSMFEQGSDVALHSFELVQLQIRIGNGENVPALGVLVNEDALVLAPELFLDLEDALAFQSTTDHIRDRA